MLKTIITILTFFSFISIKAENLVLKDVKETQELSQKVSNLFLEIKIVEAFEELIPYWPLPDNEIDNLRAQTIKQFNLLEDLFDQRIEVVKVSNQTISDFAIREIYILKYSYSGIRLIYSYYKSENGWILNGFRWDNNMSEEFK